MGLAGPGINKKSPRRSSPRSSSTDAFGSGTHHSIYSRKLEDAVLLWWEVLSVELDAKEKVLVAIYTEYQKDIPNMDSINHHDLGIDMNVFNVAVDKLDNEGFILGASFSRVGRTAVPAVVLLKRCKMTRYGIEYVEKRFGIENQSSGQEKVKSILAKTAEWGWDQFKDFGAKVLAEIVKS